MTLIARTTQQIGNAIQRYRKNENLTQAELGARMHARQATISKLEKGEPATQLKILLDALAALDLELVIQPRTTTRVEELGDIF